MLWFDLALAAPPQGRWAFAGQATEVAAVDAVREGILDDYNFAIRPIVRTHLRRPFTIHDAIHLVPDGTAVRVELRGDDPQVYTVTLDGPRLEGDGGSVSLRSQGDTWVLELVGTDQGTIVHRFDREGSSLKVHTTIRAPRLDGDHSWTLTYRASK